MTVVSPGALYPRLLGDAWQELHPAVRTIHLDRERAVVTGTFRIRHGSGPLARMLARLLRLPAAGDGLATRLEVRREGEGERWKRRFGASTLDTTQYPGPDGRLVERFGPAELHQRLSARDGGLVYEQEKAALRVGRTAIALPRWLAPRVAGSETPATGGGVAVRVTVSAPLVGLLVCYEGEVAPEESP